MAKYPATQRKLREELLNFGREPTNRDLASMDQLPYFDAIIKETYVVNQFKCTKLTDRSIAYQVENVPGYVRDSSSFVLSFC